MSTELLSQFDDLFKSICSGNNEIIQTSTVKLQKLLKTFSSKLPLTELQLFLEELKRQIYVLIRSTVANEKIGGILIFDQLIQSKIEENSSNITRCANYLKNVLTINNQFVVETATMVLRNLVMVTETLNPPFVEKHLKSALEWIKPDCPNLRKYATLIVFKELIEPAPLNVLNHFQDFYELLIHCVVSEKRTLQRVANETLRCCLVLLSQKGHSIRLKVLNDLYSFSLQESEKKTQYIAPKEEYWF
eukprot:Anaeramoba_flamelloidesa2954_11.p1 GENE.a2954_11~~a2954_11.p1  ORF type:complete len:247 (-),score=52.31 a2954_11:24-764(-)